MFGQAALIAVWRLLSACIGKHPVAMSPEHECRKGLGKDTENPAFSLPRPGAHPARGACLPALTAHGAEHEEDVIYMYTHTIIDPQVYQSCLHAVMPHQLEAPSSRPADQQRPWVLAAAGRGGVSR